MKAARNEMGGMERDGMEWEIGHQTWAWCVLVAFHWAFSFLWACIS